MSDDSDENYAVQLKIQNAKYNRHMYICALVNINRSGNFYLHGILFCLAPKIPCNIMCVLGLDDGKPCHIPKHNMIGKINGLMG